MNEMKNQINDDNDDDDNDDNDEEEEVSGIQTNAAESGNPEFRNNERFASNNIFTFAISPSYIALKKSSHF